MTLHHGLQGIEEDARRWGVTKLFNRDQNRVEWTVACGCGSSESRPFGSNNPPAYMVRKFKQFGWKLSEGDKPICPRCIESARAKTRNTMVEPTKIGPDLKLARRIMFELDEHFDEKAHRYEAGWSDAHIANTVGCPAAMVAHIRIEGGYGELAEDPELEAIKAELDTFKDAARGELEGLAAETKAALNSAVDRFKNEVLAIQHRANADLQAALTLLDERYANLTMRLSKAS